MCSRGRSAALNRLAILWRSAAEYNRGIVTRKAGAFPGCGHQSLRVANRLTMRCLSCVYAAEIIAPWRHPKTVQTATSCDWPRTCISHEIKRNDLPTARLLCTRFQCTVSMDVWDWVWFDFPISVNAETSLSSHSLTIYYVAACNQRRFLTRMLHLFHLIIIIIIIEFL